MNVRHLVLLLACLAGAGCATGGERAAAREPVTVAAHHQPVDRLHHLMDQRRYYEGFLLWPQVEQALARTSGHGALGREYARLITLAARADNEDEWRWIMASPRIARRLKVDLVTEIGTTD